MRYLPWLALSLFAAVGCDQPMTSTAPNTPPKADNTAVNKRDAEGETKTPIDQKENQADIDITAKIRKDVLEIENASVNARNVKIITADGKVTLRGPVATAEEHTAIVNIAKGVAGDGNVDDQLEVSP
ncbi:MAG TPA: BON domain-containing protein [Pirellulaceae bacterium]|nr:BON domain-containing protein [Pirellulaceae bacterium]